MSPDVDPPSPVFSYLGLVELLVDLSGVVCDCLMSSSRSSISSSSSSLGAANLVNIISQAREYDIPVHISDDSNNEETKKIIEEYKKILN